MENTDVIKAMAIAAIAEKCYVTPNRVIVRSFKEISKSSLEKYIEDNGIIYHKFYLEETKQ